MRQARNTVKKAVRFLGPALVMLLSSANVSSAKPRTVVEVTIEPRYQLNLHMNDFWPRRLRLTYRIEPVRDSQPATIRLAPDAVRSGAGLVAEHVAADDTRSTQTLQPMPWWFDKAETIRIESSGMTVSFELWVEVPLDFSEVGIYHISYAHPWASEQADPNGPIFQSNTLTIACVTQERLDQLHMMLSGSPELALAVFRFRNPPLREESSKYSRGGLETIDKAIKIGAEKDEILFLLGSPDSIGYTPAWERNGSGYDESWFYTTSPVGGYYVHFNKGKVVAKGYHADWSGDYLWLL